MRGIFVTGTDTDAGKTWVCAALMAGAPPLWRYWKPVQTGLDTDVGDTATVRQRAALPPDQAPDVGVRLGPPVSPHFAAAEVGQRIAIADVCREAKHLLRSAEFVVIEGAGGLLVPLNDAETMHDLARALDLPVLIVVRVRLGAINHALLTERVLRTAGTRTVGFVLSGGRDPSLESALAAHSLLPIVGRLPELAPAAPLAEAGEALRRAVLERVP